MSVLTLLERVLVPSLILFLLIGSLASVVLGWALVFRSARALSFMRSMNRWVSTRRALKELEVPRHVEEPRKAGKLWFGLFLVAGAGFALYVLLARIEIPRVAVVLGVNLQRWFLASVALQTMKWLLVVGSVLALAVGILMLFFPQVLAAFEARMNRWYSTRQLRRLSSPSRWASCWLRGSRADLTRSLRPCGRTAQRSRRRLCLPCSSAGASAAGCLQTRRP